MVWTTICCCGISRLLWDPAICSPVLLTRGRFELLYSRLDTPRDFSDDYLNGPQVPKKLFKALETRVQT